jgi:lipopolysaccharide heptosyltransferase II
MVKKGRIEKILYITLSNLGDAIMAMPSFDYLRRECPDARITVLAAPRTKCIFENHPKVDQWLIFDKSSSIKEKRELFFRLKSEQFDVVVDLKNTFYRWSLPARYKNPAWIKYPSWARHASVQHLLKAIFALKGRGVDEIEFNAIYAHRDVSFISARDEDDVDKLLRRVGVKDNEEFVLIVPGARSALKRWTQEGYVQVIKSIRQKYGFCVLLIGEKSEQSYFNEILKLIQDDKVFDFSGQTSFGQLASLVFRSKLVVCNDSGILQIASYLNKPVVGIYGPSDYHRYGPWSRQGILVRKNVLCAPCAQAECRHKNDVPLCIATIRPYDVLLAVRLILESYGQGRRPVQGHYRRILVVRTDRIGDVLLTTPVLKSLRDNYPSSYIAMMVSSYTRECVDGNPYLDRVIIFDKEKYNGFFSTLKFSQFLKRENFDVVLIFYPTARIHFLMFLARIRERIGYDWRVPFLLTKAIHHTKQEGSRHEFEYNFDLLKPLGIEEVVREVYMPIKETSEQFVEALLEEVGLSSRDRIVALNPSASCVSRLWPSEKFAQVADRLAAHHVKVVLVGDRFHQDIIRDVLSRTVSSVIDLSGRFGLSELASFFKRCALLISNDSGPVHIAVGVGTPVISIFGRNQPGLGPKRWGPLGLRDVALFHKTDCAPCLAHACCNHFKCLEAITVEEVLEAAVRLLS